MIAEGKQPDDGLEDVRMLTVADLASCLKVSTRQVYRMNRSALIPAPLKIGGCLRWREDEISWWLKAGAPVRSEWELKRDVELAPPVENP